MESGPVGSTSPSRDGLPNSHCWTRPVPAVISRRMLVPVTVDGWRSNGPQIA